MSTQAVTAQSEVLNSWKEIAQYMGRGVRTVQRWEATLGLPVRRPHGRGRSAVLALRSDLDKWLGSRPTRNSAEELEQVARLVTRSTAMLLQEGGKLRAEIRETRERLHETIMRLHSTLTAMTLARNPARLAVVDDGGNGRRSVHAMQPRF